MVQNLKLVMVESVYQILGYFSSCFTHISLASHSHLNQFLPRNLVGRLIMHDRVLGRYTRFYSPGLNEDKNPCCTDF